MTVAGKTVIAIAAALGLSALTGVALGQFAVTQPHASLDANAIADRTGNPDAAYGPPPAVMEVSARLSDGASTTPVCKGCGPTLSERRDRAYYGDGYEPFGDSGTSDYEYTEDPAQRASPASPAYPGHTYRPPGYTPPEVFKPVPVTGRARKSAYRKSNPETLRTEDDKVRQENATASARPGPVASGGM